MRDQFPVSYGHTLVIPKRHISNWWTAYPTEREALLALVDEVKADLDRRYHPAGCNVGFNDGAAAGQTVPHLHIHVIPRQVGDTPDPRGGVRHVIPGKGNYLLDAELAVDSAHESAQSRDSPVEEAFERELDSAAFMQQVVAIITEGRKTATYKLALLLAIIELSIERHTTGPLELPSLDIADRVIESYWRQTRPYPGTGDVLSQVRTRWKAGADGRVSHGRIIDALRNLQEEDDAGAYEFVGKVKSLCPVPYAKCRSDVAIALAAEPIRRLQRPGALQGGSDYPCFLYDDQEFALGSEADVANRNIVLHSGIASALARNAGLLRMALQNVWILEVERMNELNSAERELRGFLFGAERVDLQPVTEGLRDMGFKNCFWCDRKLGSRVEVDHVIPWSHYPSDELSNLVLTDSRCNNDKRDRLVSAGLLHRWADRDIEPLRKLARDLRWPIDRLRTAHSARSSYRYLPDGVSVWAGRKSVMLCDEGQRHSAMTLLDQLSE